ncbi:4Fe-4S ferredoxin [Alphaproteobacteria bacterium]|nr:4Fe-4S ferredoxin [Alphaproteobacteria bacterium]
MEKSQVFFTDMRVKTERGQSLLDKFAALARAAGIEKIPMKSKFVAIKMHFGEAGNLAFLRPNYARALAEIVKELGGKPFLTDCSTLYPGSRTNAIAHLQVAETNGFNSVTAGCPVIIGDGLKGTDDIALPVPRGKHVQTAKIGRAIADADIIISLNHVKGHEMAGFGGALKNLGMGCASRAGKMEQHCDGKPRVKTAACIGCKACAPACGQGALTYGADGKALLDKEKCVGCARCIAACPVHAIASPDWTSGDKMCARMGEYAAAVCAGRPHFHLSVAAQISPQCDCYGGNDAPVVPDIGMFASSDPVAIDAAAADKINAAPLIAGTCLAHAEEGDHIAHLAPETNWRTTLEAAAAAGLGSADYDLKVVS